MRTNGLLADVRIARHDHVGWCNSDPDGLGILAAEVFGAAEPTERLVFLCDHPSRDHLALLPDRNRWAAEGRLIVADTHDVYRPVTDLDTEFDALTQVAEFDALLAQARADGYDGLRVVAENTRMLQGDDETVRRWLEWEQVTDQWQVRHPVTGTCYFDRSQLDPRRLDAALALHPMVHGADLPHLRIFADLETLVLSGSVEASDEQRFTDVLALAAAASGAVTVDASELDYLHHRSLAALASVAAGGVPVRICDAAPIVRRLGSLLPDEARLLDWV